MSKELDFALSGVILAMATGTTLTANDMDGGQLNINGLVVGNTCRVRVDGGNKNGLILLQATTIAEITDGILDTTVGAKAKPFNITIDCSKANPAPDTTARMTFGPVFSSNSEGTLNNDISINTPPDGVNIALHDIEGSTIKQVRVNNPGDVYNKTLDLTSKSTTYDFKTSCVRADTSKVATAGYIKASSAYTITYQ